MCFSEINVDYWSMDNQTQFCFRKITELNYDQCNFTWAYKVAYVSFMNCKYVAYNKKLWQLLKAVKTNL